MSPELEKYLELLEQRLFLLRALAEQLVGCRKEFVALDLDGMYGRFGTQEGLCRRFGTGVSLGQTASIRDNLLERRLDQENQSANQLNAFLGALWIKVNRTTQRIDSTYRRF